MTNPDMEQGLAAYLSSVLGPDRIVRPAVSAELLPQLEQYCLITVGDAEQEVENLWMITAGIVAVTPSMHADASPAEHAELVRDISGAFTEARYAHLAAALMQQSGYLLQGFYREGSMDRFHEGRWVAGAIVRFGIELGSWAPVSGLDLATLAGGVPANGAPGAREGSLIQTDAQGCVETIPAARYQCAVVLSGAMTIGGASSGAYVRPWSSAGTPTSVELTVAPNSIVALSWALG
jgi:hypothetical protein